MEKKIFSYKRATQRLFSYIVDSLDKGKTLQRISEGLRNIVNSYQDLNRNERYRLYLSSYNVARAAKTSPDWEKYLCLKKCFDSISTSARVAKSAVNMRLKQERIRAMLKESDQIFFICSQHEHPAEDHSEWQGLIYVDRFWRTKVSGELYRSVYSYIKNHDIVTVQTIMGAPVYLTTRPNCKHYFIPLKTGSVLHNSIRKIREEIGYRKDVPYSEKEKGELRRQVFSNLYISHPCCQFKKEAEN